MLSIASVLKEPVQQEGPSSEEGMACLAFIVQSKAGKQHYGPSAARINALEMSRIRDNERCLVGKQKQDACLSTKTHEIMKREK